MLILMMLPLMMIYCWSRLFWCLEHDFKLLSRGSSVVLGWLIRANAIKQIRELKKFRGKAPFPFSFHSPKLRSQTFPLETIIKLHISRSLSRLSDSNLPGPLWCLSLSLHSAGFLLEFFTLGEGSHSSGSCTGFSESSLEIRSAREWAKLAHRLSSVESLPEPAGSGQSWTWKQQLFGW